MRELGKKQIALDAAKALSLANLCFIVIWTELLSPARPFWLEMPVRYSFNEFVSVVVGVSILAVFLFASISLARKSGSLLALKVARLVFPLTLFIPLNGFIRMLLPHQRELIQLMVLLPVIGVIALSDIRPWDAILVRGASAIVLVLFPFVFVTFAQALWSLTKFSVKPLEAAIPAPATPNVRVLWVVFDEMDERMTSPNRPAKANLPELDRLRGHALFASNAYPPADVTLMSMPALITGELISDVRPLNPSDVEITFSNAEKPVRFSSQSTVFSDARAAGFNTAIVGNYFPYCRIVGDLTACYQHDDTPKLPQKMLNDVGRVLRTIPLAPNVESFFGLLKDARVFEREERQKEMDSYIGVLEDAKRLAADPGLGLTLIHFPVPHPPNIYDRQEDKFDLAGERSYLDNLELCDRALGELRVALESAGLWDKTIILVTSDHWWRTEVWRSGLFWSNEDEETMPRQIDRRIPFVLKLAGQKDAVAYEPAFNTVLTRNLLLALLKGDVSQPADVVSWLDQHRSIGESPYHFR